MSKENYILCPNCNNYEYTGISNCRRCGFSLISYNYNPYNTPYQNEFINNRMIVCEKCGIGYDYKYKQCPKCNKKKPQSGLSIAAQILAVISFFLPMWLFFGLFISFCSMILGLIDIIINDKKKRHTGAYDGIFVFCFYIILIFIFL